MKESIQAYEVELIKKSEELKLEIKIHDEEMKKEEEKKEVEKEEKKKKEIEKAE
jgi:hypothetical protein